MNRAKLIHNLALPYTTLALMSVVTIAAAVIAYPIPARAQRAEAELRAMDTCERAGVSFADIRNDWKF